MQHIYVSADHHYHGSADHHMHVNRPAAYIKSSTNKIEHGLAQTVNRCLERNKSVQFSECIQHTPCTKKYAENLLKLTCKVI